MKSFTTVSLLCVALLASACCAEGMSWVPVRFRNMWDYHRPSTKDWGLSLLRGPDMDSFFSDFPAFAMDTFSPLSKRGIATDFVEKENSFEIKADLPGVRKEDIKVDVEGDVLSISVEHSEERDKLEDRGGQKWHRMERTSRFQTRSLQLPESAIMDKVEAKYEDGVLTVWVPKSSAQPAEGAKRITVV